MLLAGLLIGAFFVASFLYASVGHAGASAYLAVMALAGIAPETMKPAALLLNVLVASVATVQFGVSGQFRWRILWPFLITAVPAGFFGGLIRLPGDWYKILVGFVLIYAGIRLGWQSLSPMKVDGLYRPPSRMVSLATGGGIGILAGLTGTGGGIFLTPLIVLCRWADPKQAAAISPAFILANSIAGLIGFFASTDSLVLPEGIGGWIVAVLFGGSLGAYFGSRRFGNRSLKCLLACVLLIAGTKLAFRV